MRRLLCITCFLLLSMFVVGSSPSAAQHISDEVKEQLREEGNYARRSIPSVDYDFAAYEKVERIDTPYGEYESWDHPYEPNTGRFEASEEYRLNQPYFTRTGGVKRGRFFSADSIGKIYRDHYLLWADGLGNTLYESLKISGKYGLNHYFYAPDYDPYREEPEGPVLPFTDAEIDAYKEGFSNELDYMRGFIDEIQPLYYKDFLQNPEQLWLLFTGIDTSPLALFIKALERNREGVNEEFKARYGFDLPLQYDSTEPEEVIQRIKLWEYMREQHGKVTHVRSRLFNDQIAGKGRTISNIHMSTQVNYERYGENFDHPGAAIRPMLVGNELAWKYYMGYGTRLINDLTDKVPVISPRINLASGGARIVPTPSTIKYWYSQTVQNGAVGFYDWLKDYPAREDDGAAYGGFTYGHPDPSARGQERWDTALDMAKTTSQSHVFVPPSSQVGILANIEDANVKQKWHNIFSAYIELTQADVWSTFISSTELRTQSESLDRYKLLIVPNIEYVYQTVADQVRSFVEKGGVALIADPDAFSYNMEGEELVEFRQSILGVSQVSERTSSNGEITFTDEYASSSITAYDSSYAVTGSAHARENAVAYYPDSSIAITSNSVGRGKVIFAPGSLCDTYAADIDEVSEIDEERALFYKALEEKQGIEDKSWVWDVTVDNVHELTGSYENNLPPVNENIRFRWYMSPFLP